MASDHKPVANYGTPGVANVILTSAYDAANNRTSLAATIAGVDDFLSSSTYNALNQLTRLDQTSQTGGNSVAEKRIDFAYNAIGQFTSIARYKDTTGGSTHEIATSTYSYDLLNRLTGLVYKEGATNLFTPYAWSFDNLNRITQQVSEDGTSDYAYDSTSQLTTADHDYQADEAYSYDANGNRTMTGYSTGTNNRLLNDGTHTYTYDFEGNRTKKTVTATGEATEYQWDHRNRLVRVKHLDSVGAPVQTLDYIYDVLDRRIGKTDTPTVGPGYTERYVYDGEHLTLKFGSSALANRYLHGPVIDQILADEQVSSLSSPGDVLWPLVDHLGTVRDLAEYDSGTGDTVIVNHISYDAYGGSRAETNAAVDHLFGYTGREWDAEADLQYNRARWYDPAVGRWLSEDPIGFEAGDANLSRYVANFPLGKTDPTGLQGGTIVNRPENHPDHPLYPISPYLYPQLRGDENELDASRPWRPFQPLVTEIPTVKQLIDDYKDAIRRRVSLRQLIPTRAPENTQRPETPRTYRPIFDFRISPPRPDDWRSPLGPWNGGGVSGIFGFEF